MPSGRRDPAEEIETGRSRLPESHRNMKHRQLDDDKGGYENIHSRPYRSVKRERACKARLPETQGSTLAKRAYRKFAYACRL